MDTSALAMEECLCNQANHVGKQLLFIPFRPSFFFYLKVWEVREMCTAAHGIVNTQLLLQTTEEKAVSETQQQHQQKKSEGRSFDVE